jgi:uncharacterized protein (DUF2126 family)
LEPYLKVEPGGPLLAAFMETIHRARRPVNDFLVELNQRLQREIAYVIRMEPGIQPCETTLRLRSGSCRDSAWLLVQVLRRLGLAARFVSGYLIQLKPDVKSLDGPSGAEADFTDLHAWTEAYLPGAGWIGLDPTSGLFAAEGHIPLACTPDPAGAAPITGAVEKADVEFSFEMSIERIHEDPRVTKPYSEEQWDAIEALGHEVDRRLDAADVRLTMGGEPTFVSIDDMDGDEWNTTAVGPTKRKLSHTLIKRLKDRFAPGGLLHYGTGKWYPGESLPRWALGCYWRRDGLPIWLDPELVADDESDYGHGVEDAERFMNLLARRLYVDPDDAIPAYEDVLHYLSVERRLPVNVDPLSHNWKNDEERERLGRLLEKGLGQIVGYALPLAKGRFGADRHWLSGQWPLRRGHLFLIPGDSPLGLRLPLDSLPWSEEGELDRIETHDPSDRLPPLPERKILADPAHDLLAGAIRTGLTREQPCAETDEVKAAITRSGGSHALARERKSDAPPRESRQHAPLPMRPHAEPRAESISSEPASIRNSGRPLVGVLRTALCVEPREGRLRVFMPPVRRMEDYLELVTAVEETASELGLPVHIEGYAPPHDPRVHHLKVTPDPGVIEVNAQPAANWDELVRITTGLYEEARLSRLGTEKFMLDGRHSGTGGGNHIVLGAAHPVDSPFLRRPDLLRSLVSYWHNHPALSYLFSGLFIGPTSQAPRPDEARHEAVYELELAFTQIPEKGECPPWLTDRIFRNLLVDLTGNTHRTEFCIDKLYSPDTATGRLGLLEVRSFEMPPHARMSLAQQLLLRTLIARFWEDPYDRKLVRWGTELHDRFMLPHFIEQDFRDVIEDTRRHGFELKPEWFAPHAEFRLPRIGEIEPAGIHIELRTAIEPWHVLGEEPGGGGTARYVDSSLERMQVKVQGMTDTRHIVTCNGRRLPLRLTGTHGEFVAGVRYRAWQPPHALHPTIPVHVPLVIDLVDTWNQRSLGGCTYHVAHPGGRSHETFPVNALEAESRRASRFAPIGHTPGAMTLPPPESNPEYPHTLDLRLPVPG